MTGFVVIRTEKHKHTGSRAKPLVCTVRGYVQLFVNPEDFRKIPALPPTDIMPTEKCGTEGLARDAQDTLLLVTYRDSVRRRSE